MSKHTPGPWRHSKNSNFGNCIEGQTDKRTYEHDDGYRTVAMVQAAESTGRYDAEKQNLDANIRLIAAAPELLEALKQIEPILARMYGPQAAELPPMQIARAAIAQATGGNDE